MAQAGIPTIADSLRVLEFLAQRPGAQAVTDNIDPIAYALARIQLLHRQEEGDSFRAHVLPDSCDVLEPTDLERYKSVAVHLPEARVGARGFVHRQAWSYHQPLPSLLCLGLCMSGQA